MRSTAAIPRKILGGMAAVLHIFDDCGNRFGEPMKITAMENHPRWQWINHPQFDF